jgi:hypothetical protein
MLNKKGFVPILLIIIVLAISTAIVFYLMRNQQKAKAATDGTTPFCSFSLMSGSTSIKSGDTLSVSERGFADGESINLSSSFGPIELAKTLNSTTIAANQPVTIPSSVPAGQYNLIIITRFPITTTNCSPSPFNIVFTFAGLTACDVDVNHDGKVNSTDLLAVSKNTTPTYPYVAVYDVNKDGKVNSTDLLIVSKFQGQTCMPPTVFPGATGLSTINQSCTASGLVNATLKWTPQPNGTFILTTAQWLDITTKNDNFANGFISANVGVGTSTWSNTNTPPNSMLYWRINTLNALDNHWYSSSTASFATISCPLPTLMPSPSPPIVSSDTDSDGFSDVLEAFIGTNPNLACGVAAWPPDLNDDKTVNILDQQMMASKTFAVYDKRFDLNGDGRVNSTDQLLLAKLVGKTCT